MDNAKNVLAIFYDGQKKLIDKIEPAIEPILTVIMGFVVELESRVQLLGPI